MSPMNKRVTDEEQKIILLDILKYFDDFCRENELKYFLVGGSLIGAIRHKGFIPWDDDIDVAMLPDDYKKMVAIFNEKSDGRYTLLEKNINPDYYLQFGKIVDNRTVLQEHIYGVPPIAIGIDVFQFEYLKENSDKSRRLLSEQSFFEKIIGYKSSPCNPSRGKFNNNASKIMRVILPVRYKKMDQIRAKRTDCLISNVPTEWVVNRFGAWRSKEINRFSNFAQTIDAPFESIIARIPIGYDEILSRVYGDYMTLPSEEKRVSHHGYDAYWK